MKITYFDLETSPILGYAFQTYKTDLLSIEKESGLLAFAYKVDDGPVQVFSRRTYSERQLVRMLWKLFDQSDILCAQNGDRFDIRVANKLFVRYNMNPPSPYKTIDTLKMARRYFRFDSNKLDNLAQFLLGERKISTGKELWLSCIAGEKKALKQMEEYCAHDVELLYRLYQRLKMWHTGHPNYNLYAGSTHQCPVCGGDTQKRGTSMTRVGIYQRHQCKKCGAWSQGEKINTEKVIR